MTAKTMAEVLAEHQRWVSYCGPEQECGCGARLTENDDAGMAAHQSEALSVAGFGLVADAKAPEVRYATLTNGETELDEVVATNATVHLEAMADNHWWLLVESGGESVHVNFYTKRAKISGHAETDS